MPFDSTSFDYTKVAPTYDKNNPPKRMSEAIRMALLDLEAAERLPKYRINMTAWHEPAGDGVCEVCLAGSVMALTCQVSPNELHTGNLVAGLRWNRVFDALNQLRLGDVRCAAFYMNVPKPSFFNATITDYGENPDQFKADMLALADRLEAEGS